MEKNLAVYRTEHKTIQTNLAGVVQQLKAAEDSLNSAEEASAGEISA